MANEGEHRTHWRNEGKFGAPEDFQGVWSADVEEEVAWAVDYDRSISIRSYDGSISGTLLARTAGRSTSSPRKEVSCVMHPVPNLMSTSNLVPPQSYAPFDFQSEHSPCGGSEVMAGKAPVFIIPAEEEAEEGEQEQEEATESGIGSEAGGGSMALLEEEGAEFEELGLIHIQHKYSPSSPPPRGPVPGAATSPSP